MRRLAVAVVFLTATFGVAAQSSNTASDPFAVSLAQKSMTAMTGGAPVQSVSLQANVISIFGSDYETGTGLFQAQGFSQSRTDLSLSGGARSDVRTNASGAPCGAWQKNSAAPAAYANSNCSTDAAWFFPALSSLASSANPSYVFQYLGQTQHGGLTAEHIRVFQPNPSDNLAQHLSTMEFYLDPSTFLPLAVTYQVHPDQDALTDIPGEVRFASYQPVNGIQVPFHAQRMLNGGVVTDITVTKAVFNTSIPSSTFSLQ